MPEPFAVFQYYRYGVRHPLIAEQRKYVALVLDFGGGTFDVSVVESTKFGEISGGGVNSRPLGAKSIQVGGFYINRLVAEDALFSALAKGVDKASVRKSLEMFYKNKNADIDFLSQLHERQRSFFRNFKNVLQAVERAKIAICNSIANWDLTENLAGVAPFQLSIPVDPFSSTSVLANVRLDAGKFRKLFEERIWAPKLKDAIVATMDRARADIGGQPISVVLLSGGSSNIRWLRKLLDRDLRERLSSADILELNENFQEVVAKGLAVECARRYYTGGQGDFRAVTYNRLCLLLRSDDGQLEHKRFRPSTSALASLRAETDMEDNVLLPSASGLRTLVEQPLRWKVRLSSPPKRVLQYYFTRSSFDPDEVVPQRVV